MLKLNYKLEQTYNGDGTVTISKTCAVSDNVYSVVVNSTDWQTKLNRLQTAQSIWPDMNLCDREFLISGVTPGEWDYLYGNE